MVEKRPSVNNVYRAKRREWQVKINDQMSKNLRRGRIPANFDTHQPKEAEFSDFVVKSTSKNSKNMDKT